MAELPRESRRRGARARLLAAVFAASCLQGPIEAAEIDSWTRRDEPLADARRSLEQRLQEAIRAGVDRANASDGVCDEAALYAGVRRAFAQPFIGHVIAESLNADASLDSRRVRRVDSVYRDLDWIDAVSVRWKDLSAVVRVGDAIIGVDKIGHFIVEGWGYFETAELDGEGLGAALDWGERAEDTYFGHLTTGVRSQADLVANFEGLRFWQRMIGEGTDPLEGGRRATRSYVRCGKRLGVFGERRWRVSRRVDLGDFVTPAWDEAVNCCHYRTPEIASMVRARIEALAGGGGLDGACPVDAGACAAARVRYGAWAPRLLHPDCLAAEPEGRPWWRFW